MATAFLNPLCIEDIHNILREEAELLLMVVRRLIGPTVSEHV